MLQSLFLMVLIGYGLDVINMKYTTNFTREELIASSTARKLKIDNTPSKEVEANLKLLA